MLQWTKKTEQRLLELFGTTDFEVIEEQIKDLEKAHSDLEKKLEKDQESAKTKK